MAVPSCCNCGEGSGSVSFLVANYCPVIDRIFTETAQLIKCIAT